MKLRDSSLWCAIAMLSLALLASACGKKCKTAAGCVRTCNCTDSSQGKTFPCPMTFNCDDETETCDPMHDKSCDEICDKYASVNACGRQCVNDAQCLFPCDCPTTTGSVYCEVPFSCDESIGVCDVEHRGASCEAICQACVVSP